MNSPLIFSDLLEITADGRPRLPAHVHFIPELLELDAETVLARFKVAQEEDFHRVLADLDRPESGLAILFGGLRDLAASDRGNRLAHSAALDRQQLTTLFLSLHHHVMSHPVWRHPFFLRIFRGDFTLEQLQRFALHYFNQVKNTRQCVALALGRFNGTLAMPYGQLNERVSELAQIVLAQLIADEYGVSNHELADYPSIAGLLGSTTHIVMYRKIFDGLGIPFLEQDVAMLHGVADNVLTQRLVAGDAAFTPLEGLASVGLGMEWGVPEFFSLLLGGMVRFAWQQNHPLTSEQLQVFIAHVQYDVLHAISVMLVTSFFADDDKAERQIAQATNILMASRYGMMNDLYLHVFGEVLPPLTQATLAPCYWIDDRRIEERLCAARREVAIDRVVNGAAYRELTKTPFVFGS
jgi:hypothetical protein